jgi:hypothetical protein
VGVWKYSKDIDNAVNSCPLVNKYCGIYETYGDKRLATNLMTGLVILMDRIVSKAFQKGMLNEDATKEIYEVFNPIRVKNGKI